MFNFSAGICDLERESVGSSVNNKEFGDVKFYLLSTALDRFVRFYDCSCQIDDAFTGDVRHISDHFFGSDFGLEGTSLESVEVFSKNNKAVVSLTSYVVNSCSD